MKNKQTDKTKVNHDNILKEIQAILLLDNIERDVQKQIDNFYNDPAYKSYKDVRNDKGYNNWKAEVIKRFGNQCCVCYSTDKMVAHHLYSYKYYPKLRTEVNNGVCICNTCHELFNDLYSNVNTLEQFIQYREKFKGKNHDAVKKQIQSSKSDLISNFINKASPNKSKPTKTKLSPEEKQHQDNIVFAFEELMKNLADEYGALQKKYGYEKGIQIDFRDKTTTSLSAISKLRKEITRLNTLISCNKMQDKTIMAFKFHMPYADFCKKLQDPKEYLSFTDSEITHLNKILSEDYKKEHAVERAEVFAKLNKK